MKTFIDLFSGIGGFRVALEKRGLECVFSSDIDEKAREAYRVNFTEEPEGDITEIAVKKIPKHDILCAGFPCQSFSISGAQKGLDDNRGRLFFEIVRIAEFHKPSIILLENVRNILTVDNSNVINTIRKELDRIGYNLQVDVLNSSVYGVAQSRERVYFVGIRKDISKDISDVYQAPLPTFEQIYLEKIVDKEVDNKLFINRKDKVINYDEKGYGLKPIRVGQVNKGGQGERIYSVKGHSITLSAYGGGVGARTGLYLFDDKVRKLSINECKKLMGFDTTHYVSHGMQGYQQLGNAVIPIMIGKVYDSINIR